VLIDFKKPKSVGIFLGVLYGISIRVALELEQFEAIGGLVSLSFMFLVPFL